jgi:hypothetical protein
MNRRGRHWLAIVAFVPGLLHAREVDQFSDRLFQVRHLADSSAVIDARMNEMLRSIAAALSEARPTNQPDRDRIVYDAFQGDRFEFVAQLRTPFESWVRDDADVELFHVDGRGIYGGDVDYDDMGMAWYIESAPVIRLGPLLVGIDKLGHFIGQGWFYYRRYERIRNADPAVHDDEVLRRVREYGHELEVGYQGLVGTGVYSYADLAANWQGMQFYRSLFAGPSPYFQATHGRYRLVREFHILDYATDDWDEVQNPSRPRSDRFYVKVARYLRAHACSDFRGAPSKFLNASGRTQDPREYVWDGAGEAAFACKRRFSIADLCRSSP